MNHESAMNLNFDPLISKPKYSQYFHVCRSNLQQCDHKKWLSFVVTERKQLAAGETIPSVKSPLIYRSDFSYFPICIVYFFYFIIFALLSLRSAVIHENKVILLH